MTTDNPAPGPNTQLTLGRLGGIAPGDAERGNKTVWLDGGGYRAAVFHLGALTRINELGGLAGAATVGAVAGGSIIAALLATRVEWPIHSGYRGWPEEVAAPMRELAGRSSKGRLLRRPIPFAGGAASEERFARELIRAGGGEPARGPRFVFGASGLILSGLAAGWEECAEWNLAATTPGGYPAAVVEEVILAIGADLYALKEVERAVLENHGYLLADAAMRELDVTARSGIRLAPPLPPHPRWMDVERVRLATARRRVRRPSRASQWSEPASETVAALLERHRPLLNYDSLECYTADAVEVICEMVTPERCNTLHRADGTLLAAARPEPGGACLDLDFMRGTTYASGEPALPGDYLDECGGAHAADAIAGHRRAAWADVVYGRASRDSEDRLWLQYWFFHYYDDKGLLGVEQHEGDWEMVQIRLGGDLVPKEATLSRPGGAERLRWDQLERARVGGGEAPVIYPARGSHAPLPRPGSFAAPVLFDHSDGQGSRVRPRLVEIDESEPGWVLWPGRWGSTRRRESFEGNSPAGPRQQPQWWDPAEIHAAAHPFTEPVTVTPPQEPHFEAHREGGVAVVDYTFAPFATDPTEPARFVAAVITADSSPSPVRSIPVDGMVGSFALHLSAEVESVGIRAGLVSTHGRAGRTLDIPLL